MRNDIDIVGCRSPLVVDLEESIERSGFKLRATISVAGEPRVLDRSKVVSVEDIEAISKLVNDPGAGFLTCAFSTQRRMELVDIAEQIGLDGAPPLIDITATISKSSRIGHGTFVNSGVAFGGACFVGDHVLINRNASVGHHCFVEDFVSLAPGVTIASNVKIGRGATIGAGAVIVPNVIIGENSVVGAGSIVLRDVPVDTFVAGNPAREKTLNPTTSRISTDGEE